MFIVSLAPPPRCANPKGANSIPGQVHVIMLSQLQGAIVVMGAGEVGAIVEGGSEVGAAEVGPTVVGKADVIAAVVGGPVVGPDVVVVVVVRLIISHSGIGCQPSGCGFGLTTSGSGFQDSSAAPEFPGTSRCAKDAMEFKL